MQEIHLFCQYTPEEYKRLQQLFDSRKDQESKAFGTAGFWLEGMRDGIYLKGLPVMDEDKRYAVGCYLNHMFDFARQAKRVNHPRKRGASEKYSFRLWLNRIGMSGPQFKKVRKLLTQDLQGSASRAYE